MTTASPTVAQAPRLTTDQIAQFKREGFLVLPGVVDPELCRQARDQMWDTIAQHRPSMRRDDPSTWTPISDEEHESYTREETGGDAYFGGGGNRYYIRNGAEDLLLDIGARVVWDVAEQLLGEGEVVYPTGLDATGHTTGPCFLTEDAVKGMESHLGDKTREWTGPPTNKTGPLPPAEDRSPLGDGPGHARHVLHAAQRHAPAGRTIPPPTPARAWARKAAGRCRPQSISTTCRWAPAGLHLWPGSHHRGLEGLRRYSAQRLRRTL